MDYLLVHANQKNYVVIGVTFAQNGKVYHYKAELDAHWRIGDKAVVMAQGFDGPTAEARTDNIRIVQVVAVHQNPLAVLTGERPYRWALGKVDFAGAAAREDMQDRMIAQLREWEVQRQTLQLIEQQRALVASLPNGEESFKQFASLGETAIRISL